MSAHYKVNSKDIRSPYTSDQLYICHKGIKIGVIISREKISIKQGVDLTVKFTSDHEIIAGYLTIDNDTLKVAPIVCVDDDESQLTREDLFKDVRTNARLLTVEQKMKLISELLDENVLLSQHVTKSILFDLRIEHRFLSGEWFKVSER